MNDTPERTLQFSRNTKLESYINELNTLLEKVQQEKESDFETPPYPAVFVIGPPRSGTTLLVQWLASSGLFSYPTNLLSRFYAAPYIGALVQEILTNPECDFRGEFWDLHVAPPGYDSDVGKTQGALSPNEFWYWWRQFVPHNEICQISAEQEEQVDLYGFRRSLASIQDIWPKPFVTKGKLLQYNLRCLLGIFPKSLFLYSYRHPLYNMQSLLITREKYFGTKTAWFSAKPPGHDAYLTATPEEQVAAQTYLTNQSIQTQLQHVDDRNWLQISHEQFCADPSRVFYTIIQKLSRLGFAANSEYAGPNNFTLRNNIRVDNEEAERIRLAYETISGTNVAWTEEGVCT